MGIETMLAALIGGIFGGGITVIVTYIQSKNNLNRDYIKIAHELAVEEYRTHFEIIKSKGSGGELKPIEANMAYYMLFVRILEQKDFSPEKLKEFRETRIEINQIYKSS